MTEKTIEEVTATIHRYMDDVEIDDRTPNAEPIRLFLDESSVRRDTHAYKAIVRPSREPRRWSYVFEDVAISTVEMLEKAGLNVYFTIDDPLEQ